MTVSEATIGALNSLAPSQVETAFVKPLARASLATQATISTPVRASGHSTLVPVLNSDVGAQWTAEGAEIEQADASFSELEITTKKLARVVPVTSEFVEDASADINSLLAGSLVRSFALAVDEAYFGSPTGANAPAGLASATTSGSAAQSVDFSNGFDDFAAAISTAQEADAEPTAFVVSPAALLALRTVHEQDDSKRPLLQPDASAPSLDTVFGIPVYASRYLDSSTGYLLSARDNFVCVSRAATVSASDQALYTSDRIALKGTLRIGFGFAAPERIVKLTIAGVGSES